MQTLQRFFVQGERAMALFQFLIRQYRLGRTRAILGQLSDRQLDDIGLTRADLYGPTANTWFSPIAARSLTA